MQEFKLDGYHLVIGAVFRVASSGRDWFRCKH
jgi:hypothetical protein